MSGDKTSQEPLELLERALAALVGHYVGGRVKPEDVQSAERAVQEASVEKAALTERIVKLESALERAVRLLEEVS